MDPTSRGDLIAQRVRDWYEANRESWFDRHAIGLLLKGHALGASPDRTGEHADEWILGLIQAVHQIEREVPK